MSNLHPFLAPNAEGGFIPFAHRGGSQQHPENSLAAFRHAWELGYRYLETDVQLTADGAVVAFHDDDLSRTCGLPRRISSMNWAELQQARIDEREPVPRLLDLLEEFPLAYVNIDAKSDAVVGPLIDILKRAAVLDRVCIGAFSHRRLGRIRSALGSSVCTSASPFEVAQWVAGRLPTGPSCLQVPLRQGALKIVTERSVARAAAKRVPIHVWTVDDPATMQMLLDMGVHGIMTDRADVLRSVARTNGIWPG